MGARRHGNRGFQHFLDKAQKREQWCRFGFCSLWWGKNSFHVSTVYHNLITHPSGHWQSRAVQVLAGKDPEGRVPVGRAPEGKVPEGRVPERRASEGRAPQEGSLAVHSWLLVGKALLDLGCSWEEAQRNPAEEDRKHCCEVGWSPPWSGICSCPGTWYCQRLQLLTICEEDKQNLDWIPQTHYQIYSKYFCAANSSMDYSEIQEILSV